MVSEIIKSSMVDKYKSIDIITFGKDLENQKIAKNRFLI